MLSAETASGKYPREAVAMMTKIIVEAEQHFDDAVHLQRRLRRPLSIAETICESVAHAAWDLEMRAIAVYTETGTTARLISKYRPPAQIFGFSKETEVCNRLNLLWGVHPVKWEHGFTPEEMVVGAERKLAAEGVVHQGDVIGVVAGTKMLSGATNLMRLHVVGALEETRERRSDRRRKGGRGLESPVVANDRKAR